MARTAKLTGREPIPSSDLFDTAMPDTQPAPECSHDYEHYVRKGRLRYHCPKCDADITMGVVLLAELEWADKELDAE